MKFSIKENDPITILTLAGRFDAQAVFEIRRWLKSHTDVHQVIVDLSGVNLIDSTALSALIQGLKWTRQRGGDLYLAGLHGSVNIIFELTRLDKAFKIFPTVEAATAGFLYQIQEAL